MIGAKLAWNKLCAALNEPWSNCKGYVINHRRWSCFPLFLDTFFIIWYNDLFTLHGVGTVTGNRAVAIGNNGSWTFEHTSMHSSRMRTAHFGGRHYMSVLEGLCLQGGGGVAVLPWWTDKHLWKHYLPTTWLMGNKYIKYIRTHWSRSHSRSQSPAVCI